MPENSILNELRQVDPLVEDDRCLRLLEKYLLPKAAGGGGARAHQFTINGLTWPFVRWYNFAAVPDPAKDRRYDMYAGLHLPAIGDLLFFFQADPQAPGGGINSRRGIRGVYLVTSTPYRSAGPVKDTVTEVGYELLAKCPKCSSQHATFSSKCPTCNNPYPEFNINKKPFGLRVLSSHVDIEPLYVFERSVSDERVYADLSDPGLIWIGRHDNAMGPGKGSSIRHLLPEEAIKLTRLLIKEPGQDISERFDNEQTHGLELLHKNGKPIDYLPTALNGEVEREDELYYLITRQLQCNNSPLKNILTPMLPDDISWGNLEYASSTFPWGYTAGTADYAILFRNEKGRRLIVVIECKPKAAHDETVLQVMLYMERVLQVMTMSSLDGAVHIGGDPIQMIPIVLAKRLKRPRNGDPRVGIPKPYTIERKYWGGKQSRAIVHSPLFLCYKPNRIDEGYCNVTNFSFDLLDNTSCLSLDWRPPEGVVGTKVELDWVKGNSWLEAKRQALSS